MTTEDLPPRLLKAVLGAYALAATALGAATLCLKLHLGG